VSTQTKSDKDRVKEAPTLSACMDTLQEMSEDPRQEAALSAALLPALAVGGNLAEAVQVNFIQPVRTGFLLSGAQSALGYVSLSRASIAFLKDVVEQKTGIFEKRQINAEKRK